MSDRHLALAVLFAIITAASLASFATCGYMVKYVQLMPGQLEEIRKTKLALGFLACVGLVLTLITIFR